MRDNALPERPVPGGRNLVTPEGMARIENEMARLQTELDRTNDESARLYLARDLRYWMARRASAEVVPPALDVGAVRFGSTVTVDDENELRQWRIVGEDEADPHAGTLSYIAPLARALMGKEIGDHVTVGGHHWTIVDIT